MVRLLRLLIGLLRCFLSSRRDLWLENLTLRQQLTVFKRGGWPTFRDGIAPRTERGNLDHPSIGLWLEQPRRRVPHPFD
jgi:hypothetical protein